MSTSRPAASPPLLEGFTYLSVLGSGGYSDVFLYEQARPKREVAVKVLLESGLTDVGRRQFAAEADLMARVSTHPYIVTIYDAAVSSDGRPFLVMEYYQRDTMAKRARQERLSVPDVLRIGVQVASAVETAHRAGILHRDIKPANILMSEYGRPGLTDFGISANRADIDDDEGGMSVPWSPPEVFRPGAVTDERADVYSLAATVWNLLAGRSPFEIPGGDNRTLSMIRRIEGSAVPAIGRDDVPESLERILRQCMSKLPEARLPSALEFARALNGVQQELSLGATPIDIPEDAPVARVQSTDTSDETRYRPRVVEAQAPLGTTGTRPIARAETAPVPPPPAPGLISGVPLDPAAAAAVGATGPAPTGEPVDERTMAAGRVRGAQPEVDGAVGAAPVEDRPGAKAWVLVVGVLVVLGIVGGVLVATLRGQTPLATAGPTPSLSPIVDPGGSPVKVTVARSAKPGQVVVTFTSDDPDASDVYRVTRTDDGTGSKPDDQLATSPLVLKGVGAGDNVCVSVVRSTFGHPQPPVTGCLS
jgi:serine/threonine-protein kinase PknK